MPSTGDADLVHHVSVPTVLGTLDGVVLVVGTLILVVCAVAFTGGSFARLGQIKLRALWLLIGAFLAQVVLEFVGLPKARYEDLGFALLLGTYVMILAFCWLNRRVSGMLIVTIGVCLNVLVITLNQGMPTKDDVVERNGRTVHVPIERTVKHRPAEDDDLLPFLGDVLTVPGFERQQFSIGDIVIALGVADVCFEASRRPRRRGDYLPEARRVGVNRIRTGSSSPARSSTSSSADEHPLVVQVRRRARQRLERERRLPGPAFGQLVERARDLEDLAREHRWPRGVAGSVRKRLGGDDVAGGREQRRAAQDRGTRRGHRARLGVTGRYRRLVEAHLHRDGAAAQRSPAP